MLQSSSGFIIPKTIIYVATKNMAWKVYSTLHREAAKRCYVSVYHADLTSHTKSAIYREFKSSGSSLRCLVATVAFGMVRFPINFFITMLTVAFYCRAWIFLMWRWW